MLGNKEGKEMGKEKGEKERLEREGEREECVEQRGRTQQLPRDVGYAPD